MILSKKLMVVLAILCVHTVVWSKELQSLNIMFVVAYFPAPSQTYILNMMTGLIDKGHKISIFALRKNDVVGQSNIAKYGLMDVVMYEKLPEELPECDIIFCQSGTLGRKFIEMEGLTEWLEGKKLVVCLRGGDVTSYCFTEKPEIYEKIFRRGDLFLPVCEYFKKKLIGLGCDPHKVVVHHSAINCSKFFFKERKMGNKKQAFINLVSVCRLVQKKGLHFALEAVAEVLKKYKNIHFTIVGDGHYQRPLKKLVQELGIGKKVTFFGWGTQDQVVKVLNNAHIFLSPSVQSTRGEEEGIANSLKEAMAMGLISIGTWHAGTPELIEDKVSGFLVPERSSRAIAKKIKYIIKHPEIWKSIGLAARKKVEDEFEIKKAIEHLETLFYGLIECNENKTGENKTETIKMEENNVEENNIEQDIEQDLEQDNVTE